MQQISQKYGQRLLEGTSTAERFAVDDPLTVLKEKFAADGTLFVWTDAQVCGGTVKSGAVGLPEGFALQAQTLVELRAFNEEQELHIRRTADGKLQGRLRRDGDGAEVSVLEADQLLTGTDSDSEKEWSHLHEAEYGDLTVPGSWQIDLRQRLAVTVRGYLSYDQNGRAGVVDTRFVKLTAVEGGE